MEKKFNLLLCFFIAVAIITLLGFFNTYIKFLPDANKFPLAIHLHFAAFSCWLILLIIQPYLIKSRNTKLHKKIGKLTYFFAPFLVWSIALVANNQIRREIALPDNDAHIQAFILLIDIITFSLFYIIAMMNSRNLRWHVAFLIAATLVVLNPGLSRLLNKIEYGLGVVAAIFIPFIVSIGVIIIEKFKYKRAILKSPYFLYLCIWTITMALFFLVPNTSWWKEVVNSVFIG